MLEPLTTLDRLSEVFATTNQRVVVTALALAVLAAVVVTSQRLQRKIDARARTLYADVAVTVVLVGSCLLAVAVTLGVWGLTDEVGSVLSRYDMGSDVIARSAVTFIFVLTAYIVTRFARRLVRDVLEPAASVTDHQQEITTRVTQVVIWSAALVVVLGIWVDDLGGLLVGAGFLGIVVGMAAQKTLGSMLSGFVLMFSRPFEIGDWIEVEDNQGIVTDISIVNTRIQSFDGEYIVIPNDVVGSTVVTNRSRRGRLRVEVEVGVDYEADVDRAADIAEAAVSELDASMSVPKPRVVTKSFGDSSIDLGVRFWIENPTARRWNEARSRAVSSIKRAFDEEDVKIPYPQRELSGREETDGFRVARNRLAYDETDSTDTDGSTASDAKRPQNPPADERPHDPPSDSPTADGTDSQFEDR